MGVFIYNPQDKTFEHYFSDNSALVSNRIFTILPEVDGRIMMSTENGITCFHTKERYFVIGLEEKACCLHTLTQRQERCVK